MAGGDSNILVQSLAAGYPVAVSYENVSGVGTGAIQWMQARSSAQPIGTVQASVTGQLFATASVTGQLTVTASVVGVPTVVGSVWVSQATSPWVVLPGSTGAPQGTVVASVIGQVTATASVVGQLTVTASVVGVPTVVGSVQATVVGSVAATQAGAWTFTGSVVATQGGAPWLITPGSTAQPQGTTVASVIGQVTVTASVAGTVGVTQSTSPWVVIPGSTGAFQGFTVSSVVGIPTVVGSVTVTQASTLAPFTVIVASTMGGGNTVTGSVFATLVVSGGAMVAVTSLAAGGALKVDLVQGTITGADGAILDGSAAGIKASVRSYAGGVNPLVTQLVSSGGVLADITSRSGGNALKVDLVQGTISGANGALLDGVDNTIAATVRSYASGVNPLMVQIVSSGTVTPDVMSLAIAGFGGPGLHVVAGGTIAVGLPTTNVYPLVGGASALDPTSGTMTAVGSRTAQQLWSDAHGRLIVRTDSVAVSQANTAAPFTVTGSMVATQGGAPWSVSGSVQATVIGSIAATQAGAWVMTGSVGASQLGAPWSTVGSIIGTVVASVIGQVTVTASIAGTVGVTQTTSPWVVLPGSTGQPQGTVVASVVGQQTVTASLIGIPTVVGSVLASQGGAPWSMVGSAVIQGSVQATVAGSVQATVIGSVGATGTIASSAQVSSAHPPLLFGGFALPAGVTPPAVGSYGATVALFTPTGLQRVAVDSGFATVTGSFAGTVVASVIGQPTVTASLIGVPTIVGSVHVTQATSPWVVLPGSTGQPQGTVVASIIGTPTVTGSLFVTLVVSGGAAVSVTSNATGGALNVTGSVLAGQGTTPWVMVGSVGVTQISSPWAVLPGSTGAFQGFTVASIIGQPTVTASVIGTIASSVAGTVVCSFESTVFASIGSSTQGAGMVSIAASATAPASITGGALNVRALPPRSGKISLFTAQVFSRGTANFTVSVSAVAAGHEAYQSFVLYLHVSKTNSPTDIRIRPQFGDGSSYYDLGQGFWSDYRLSTAALASPFVRTLTGPNLGAPFALVVDGDTKSGSGSFTLTAQVEFIGAPLWMGT
jgi:hypothetical protein